MILFFERWAIGANDSGHLTACNHQMVGHKTLIDAHRAVEVVDEEVLNSQTHTMDLWLILRLSFPNESTSTFFLFQLPFISQSGLGECCDVWIWDFLSSLEMMMVPPLGRSLAFGSAHSRLQCVADFCVSDCLVVILLVPILTPPFLW